MGKKDFKYIKGKLQNGCPADIYFYTDVDYWSVQDFLYEFDYLTNYIEPSVIRIHINSVGGNVVDGMSVFSRIADCAIPTECINDALAASMGSIIWAAGDELYMKDYALLMIHNPFSDCDGYNQAIAAFTEQLKTIYVKRFGMTEEEVKKIMDGNEGDDGTFITAAQAVEKGFLKPENVIETPKAIKDKIQAALKGANCLAQIQAVFDSALASANIDSEKHNNNLKSKQMEEKISVFAALLGLTGEKATAENVTASINDLKAKASKADELQKLHDDLKAELARTNAELTGSKTSISNLTKDLNDTKAALKAYQDAEAEAKAAKVKALIDKAIKDCKIDKEEEEIYTNMAANDYELAVNILNKIPARDEMGAIIATSNKQQVAQGVKTVEQQIMAKVDEVVGNDFKFRTLN